MRYNWNGENITTDLLSAFTAALTGCATTIMALKNKSKYAVLTNGVLGVGGIILKNYTDSPTLHEVLESMGYSGFSSLGAWAAAVMEKSSCVPVWVPQKTTTSAIVATPSYSLPPAPVVAPVNNQPGYEIGYDVE